MNKTILTGRPTTDIELKQTASGAAVVTFTLAVRKWGKDNESDFINIVAWNKTAEFASRYVHKGDRIGVVGRIQSRNFDGKDGKKVYVTEVIAEEIELLERKKTGPETKETNEAENLDNLKLEEISADDQLPF